MLGASIESHRSVFVEYFSCKQKYRSKEIFSYEDYVEVHSFGQQDCLLEEAFDFHCRSVEKNWEFHDHSHVMFANGRVDAFPRAHKRTGTFTGYAKNQLSFVLLNYQNTIRDAQSLAHELGHAFHGHMAQSRSAPLFTTSVFLAETASSVSEMLFCEELKKLQRSDEYVSCLEYVIESLLGLIFYQFAVFSFERNVHEYVEKHGKIERHVLGDLWIQKLSALYGEDVVRSSQRSLRDDWMKISHVFHSPYYTISYVFGALIALNIALDNSRSDDWIIPYNTLLSLG